VITAHTIRDHDGGAQLRRVATPPEKSRIPVLRQGLAQLTTVQNMNFATRG